MDTPGSSSILRNDSISKTVDPLVALEMSDMPSMKYLVVTGGTLSGVGKGTTISCIGVVLKSMGFRVTSIKIDPYLNIDAGTMSPYEHGEVYVLADGGEVDLDLGNYERFLDITLTKDHNLTTGKVYQKVLRDEREGKYLGKTVQVVPHVTDAIQGWIQRVALRSSDKQPGSPDICLIEVGGTVGDIESSVFLEALRQFSCKAGEGNFCLCHVSYVPEVGSGDSREQKTKPTQHSIKTLREAGLNPDFIFCRSDAPLTEQARQKISLFGHISPEYVIGVHNIPNIYRAPLMIHGQNFGTLVANKLGLIPCATFMGEVRKLGLPACHSSQALQHGTPVLGRENNFYSLARWTMLGAKSDNAKDVVMIGIVGKYTGLKDSYLSVLKALEHSAVEADYHLKVIWIESTSLEAETETTDAKAYHDAWDTLRSVHGVLCPGGFGDRGIEGKMLAARYCRKARVPYLGICLGMQIAVIDFCRDALGLAGANSEEFDKETPHKAVIYMPEINQQVMGGTMRLGNRATIIRDKSSLAYRLYDQCPVIYERHRHRYEVNADNVPALEAKGLKFVGQDERGQRMEIAELADHPFFLCTQYHPEFTSRPMRPNPCFLGFVLASKGALETRFAENAGHLFPGIRYEHPLHCD